MIDIALNEIDRRIWNDELADFVPQEIYDVHTHIYDCCFESAPNANQSVPQNNQWDTYPISNWEILNRIDNALFPGRRIHRLSFGDPYQNCSGEQANAYVAREVLADPESGALMLIRPEVPSSELVNQIEKFSFLGFKPYRIHSITGDMVNCRITDYFPEKQIEVADHYGLIVMLHLSKQKGISDKHNLDDLERLSKKYPKIKWILAHCARSYYDIPLIKAADKLKNIENIWYEISSVCDTDAMDVLLSIAGPERVMYGSDDLSVGITRGKYINYGYAWAELNERNAKLDLSHCEPNMTYVRYESLRALRRACRRNSYDANEINRLFFQNAHELIYQTKKSK